MLEEAIESILGVILVWIGWLIIRGIEAAKNDRKVRGPID